MPRKLNFKVNNPYKPDESITQEVTVSNKLELDYSNSDWISIDAEFLGLDLNRDKLCSVQIASPDPAQKERQRVEIIHTYNQIIDPNLQKLLSSDIEKIFHVFSSDVPMLTRHLQTEVSLPIFDTKVAAKIAWTNSQKTSKTNLITSLIDPNYQKLEEGDSRWELEPNKWSSKMIEYAAKDVIYLHPIKLKLETMAADRGRGELVKEAMTTIPVISKLYLNNYDLSVYTF